MKKVAIYSRVSTNKQEVENQLLELREWCKRSNYEIFNEYVDIAESGSKINRPSLKRMIDDAFLRKFDVVLVWKLDRLGRSLKDLIDIVDVLKQCNIDFISMTQKMDTSVPTGKMIFYIFGAISEFERDLGSERTKLALKIAKNKGVKLGRPALPNEKQKEIMDLRRDGLSYRKIADIAEVSHGSVMNIVKSKGVQKTLEIEYDKNTV